MKDKHTKDFFSSEIPKKRKVGRPKLPEGTSITEKELITLTRKEKTALELVMVKGHFRSMASLLRYIVSSYAKNVDDPDEPHIKIIDHNWDWDRQVKDNKIRKQK